MNSLLLEDFETGARPAVKAPPQPEDLPGYSEGFAAGQEDASNRQMHLDAEVVQALAEMSFGYAEARQHILTALQPLFRTLIEKLIPELLDESYQTRVMSTLMDAVTQDIDQSLVLTVHPDHVAGLAALAARQSGLPISVRPDASLPLSAAIIGNGTEETSLDLDALRTALTTTLSAIFDLQEETLRHG